MDAKKRIAFVIIALNSGGAERVVSILSNELIHQYDITIITLKASDPFYKLDPRINVVHCRDIIPPSKNSFQAIRTNYMLFRRIRQYLKDYRIEICLGFMTKANVLSVLAARSLRIPVIISERNNPAEEVRKLSGFWRYLRKTFFPKANKLVVQTSRTREMYKGFIEESKISVIPNPIDPNFNRVQTPHDRNIVLNVGRLSDQKAQHHLISAFSEVATNDWELHIFGEGPNRSELEALVKNLGMEDRIFLPGRNKEINEFYSRAKIFAFSSLYEGFPNALLEAMYFGMACISTDCPTGPSEIIDHNKNGLLIDLNDRDTFKTQLGLLMQDEQRQRELGAAATKSMEKYEVGSIGRQWKQLIEELI